MALICEQTGRCKPAYSGPDNGDAHGLKVPEIMWHTAHTACALGVCMEMHKGASMKQGGGAINGGLYRGGWRAYKPHMTPCVIQIIRIISPAL